MLGEAPGVIVHADGGVDHPHNLPRDRLNDHSPIPQDLRRSLPARCSRVMARSSAAAPLASPSSAANAFMASMLCSRTAAMFGAVSGTNAGDLSDRSISWFPA